MCPVTLLRVESCAEVSRLDMLDAQVLARLCQDRRMGLGWGAYAPPAPLLECLRVVGVVKESMNVSISLDGKATVSDVLGIALGSSTARTIRLSPKIAQVLYRGHRV